jgi:hypothetical protein
VLEADETAAAMRARHLEAAGTKNTTAARKLTAVSSFYADAPGPAMSGQIRRPAGCSLEMLIISSARPKGVLINETDTLSTKTDHYDLFR